jgi:heterodisulfide reductase subunit B
MGYWVLSGRRDSCRVPLGNDEPSGKAALTNKRCCELVKEHKAALEVLDKIEDRFCMWLHNATTIYDAYGELADEADMVRLKRSIAEAASLLHGPLSTDSQEMTEYLDSNCGPQEPRG